MKRIKQFDIFGTTYDVEWLDDCIEIGDDGGCNEGETSSAERKIKVCTGYKGKEFREDDIENTFYHELIHAVLIEGQFLDENSSEPLVEWLAKNIRSLKKQGIL